MAHALIKATIDDEIRGMVVKDSAGKWFMRYCQLVA
jgi:hypothetical protein